METIQTFYPILLYTLMAFMVIAALGVVFLKNLFHAALCLGSVMIGTAGIYIAFHAEFLAGVQILVYVGAVMTLIIFVIMLTENLGQKTNESQSNQFIPLALVVVVLFAYSAIKAIHRTPWPITEEKLAAKASIFNLAESLLGTYVLPFELVSIILLAALIGALAIAKKDSQS